MVSDLPIYLILSSVLLASLIGSWHCVGMCGGLVTAVAKKPQAVGMYHLGRLIAYVLLGILAGFLGKYVFGSALNGVLPWILASSMGITFIVIGIYSWSGPLHFNIPKPLLSLYSKLFGKSLQPGAGSILPAFIVGFFSAFLPCGWLYSFVLASTALKNPLYSALFLFTFWVGTLPALSFAPLLVQKILHPIQRRFPKLPALLLMGVGLWTLVLKVSPLLEPHDNSQPALTCPAHETPVHSFSPVGQ